MFAITGTNDRHFYSGPAKNTADEGSVWGENGVFLPHPPSLWHFDKYFTGAKTPISSKPSCRLRCPVAGNSRLDCAGKYSSRKIFQITRKIFEITGTLCTCDQKTEGTTQQICLKYESGDHYNYVRSRDERLRFWLHSALGLALFSFCLAKVGVETWRGRSCNQR